MTQFELDPSLANEFASEPITGVQVAEVFDIVSNEEIAVLGFNSTTEEDVRSWINPPDETESAQLLIRDRKDATPAQCWAAYRDPGTETAEMVVSTHPRVPEPVGDRLAAAGWAALFEWIRNQPLSKGAQVPVRSGAVHGNEAAARRLRAAGFTQARTAWGMSGSVDGAATPTRGPQGFTIVPGHDAVVMHRIINEAFTGHWGYEPRGLEDWLALETTRPGYDPDLWRFGLLDGEPVAAMIMSRRATQEGTLYVQDLATSATCRRKGLASCLLRHAFDVATEERLTRVDLHVDSTNTDNAPEVYRRAGLSVQYAWDMFTLTLAC